MNSKKKKNQQQQRKKPNASGSSSTADAPQASPSTESSLKDPHIIHNPSTSTIKVPVPFPHSEFRVNKTSSGAVVTITKHQSSAKAGSSNSSCAVKKIFGPKPPPSLSGKTLDSHIGNSSEAGGKTPITTTQKSYYDPKTKTRTTTTTTTNLSNSDLIAFMMAQSAHTAQMVQQQQNDPNKKVKSPPSPADLGFDFTAYAKAAAAHVQKAQASAQAQAAKQNRKDPKKGPTSPTPPSSDTKEGKEAPGKSGGDGFPDPEKMFALPNIIHHFQSASQSSSKSNGPNSEKPFPFPHPAAHSFFHQFQHSNEKNSSGDAGNGFNPDNPASFFQQHFQQGNFTFGNANNSDQSGGKGSSTNTQQCSEAEMKALMSMFVEFMGFFSANNNNNGNKNKSGNQSSKSPFDFPNSDGMPPGFPPMSEQTKMSLGIQGIGVVPPFNSQKKLPNNFPPVLSMLFGGGGGKSGSTPFPTKKKAKITKVKVKIDSPWDEKFSPSSTSSKKPEASKGEIDIDDSEPLSSTENHVKEQKPQDYRIKNDDESESTNDGREDVQTAQICSTESNRDSNEETDLGNQDNYDNQDQLSISVSTGNREKKKSKKEKSKQGTLIQKNEFHRAKFNKKIQSWKSKVLSAITKGELHRLDSLLKNSSSDSPFKGLSLSSFSNNFMLTNTKLHVSGISMHQQNVSDDASYPSSSDLTSGTSHSNLNDEIYTIIPQHMEWLLKNAIFSTSSAAVGNREKVEAGRLKLCTYVMNMSFDVVFQPLRNGKNALHLACQNANDDIVKAILEKLNQIANEPKTLVINEEDTMNEVNTVCYLDLLCEESGWSALHYACAFGSLSTMEIILEAVLSSSFSERGISVLTDADLTYSEDENEEGLSPLKLTESIIHMSSQSDSSPLVVQCAGESLSDAVDHTRSDSSNLNTLHSVVSRLIEIEKLGHYSPPVPQRNEALPREERKESAQSSNQNSESKKKKKRKKKKGNQQQPKIQQTEPSNETKERESEAEPPLEQVAERNSDHLEGALLAMGFTSEQISAASEALGGTDRATADDLVMWILENGNEEGLTETTENMESLSLDETPKTNRVKSFDMNSKLDIPINQNTTSSSKSLSQESQQIDDEAAQRDAHLKAVEAQKRLIAKREEQRRINREWNNREQARQKKEKAQAAILMEEMEKRKKAEANRAQAIKLAKARTAHIGRGVNQPNVGVLHGQIQSPQHHNRSMFPNPNMTPAPNVVKSNAVYNQNVFPSSTSPFGSTNLPNLPNIGSPLIDPSLGHFHAANRPFSGYQPSRDGQGNMLHTMHPKNYVPNNMVGNHVKSPVKASVQPNLDVNSYDFPELGKGKEPVVKSNTKKKQNSKSTKGTSISHVGLSNLNDSTVSSSNNGNRQTKNTKHMKRQKQQNPTILTRNTAKLQTAKPSVSSTPPPGFVSDQNRFVSGNSFDELNPLGEIRATAKVFVPTNFNPTPAVGGMSASTTPPPGLMPTSLNNPIATSSSTATYSSNSFVGGNSKLPSMNSSNNATIDPFLNNEDAGRTHVTSLLSSVSHSLLNDVNKASAASTSFSLPSSSPHSPVPSSASSIVGSAAPVGVVSVLGEESSISSYPSNVVGSSSLLGGPISDQNTQGIATTGSGSILDSVPLNNVSLSSGSNIWGSSMCNNPSSTLGGGFSAFSFGNTPSTNNNNDVEEKNSQNIDWNTWGNSSSHGPGKSIW